MGSTPARGCCWTRPASSHFARGRFQNPRNVFVRLMFSARARKTASEAHAILIPLRFSGSTRPGGTASTAERGRTVRRLLPCVPAFADKARRSAPREILSQRSTRVALASVSTGTMRLNGDGARPACRFRRLAENFVKPTFSASFGEGQSGGTKCLAGRQTPPAGGLRSRSHRIVPAKLLLPAAMKFAAIPAEPTPDNRK